MRKVSAKAILSRYTASNHKGASLITMPLNARELRGIRRLQRLTYNAFGE